jgi:hypothetical protein
LQQLAKHVIQVHKQASQPQQGGGLQPTLIADGMAATGQDSAPIDPTDGEQVELIWEYFLTLKMNIFDF